MGIGSALEIINCSVESSSIKSGINENNLGTYAFGGIVGRIGEKDSDADNLISGCYVNIVIDADHMQYVGGISGQQWSKVVTKDCYVVMNVTDANKPEVLGGISAYIRGLLGGKAVAAIENCYVNLTVDSYSNEQRGYNYGDEDHRVSVAGILASGCGVTITNCFVNGDLLGGRYILSNSTGDFESYEVPVVTNCAWSSDVVAYDYYGYEAGLGNYFYGKIAKSMLCTFEPNMDYDAFKAAL